MHFKISFSTNFKLSKNEGQVQAQTETNKMRMTQCIVNADPGFCCEVITDHLQSTCL